MAYATWSVIYGEIPSASKWNILGSNDAAFNDGSGIADLAIARTKLATVTKTIVPVVKGAPNLVTNTAYYPDAATTTYSYVFVVPDDYVSGDLTFKMFLRGTNTANVRMRRNVYRFRVGAAFNQLHTNQDSTIASVNLQTFLYSVTILAAGFAVGDTVRVDAARLGADAADTATGAADMDGVFIEYTGRV